MIAASCQSSCTEAALACLPGHRPYSDVVNLEVECLPWFSLRWVGCPCRGDPKYSGFQNSGGCAGVVVKTSISSFIMGNGQGVFEGPDVEIEMNSRKCSSTELPR